MTDEKDIVILTGSSGFIGSAVIEKFAERFAVVGFDRETPPHPPAAAECVCIDLTDDESVEAALRRVRAADGGLVNVDDLVAMFQARHLVMRASDDARAVKGDRKSTRLNSSH